MPLSAAIEEYVIRGLLDRERANNLSEREKRNLETTGIREAIRDEIVTLDQVLNLNFVQRNALELGGVRDCIANGTIILDQATHFLSMEQRDVLDSRAVRKYLKNNTITFSQALNLEYHNLRNLESEAVRHYIDRKAISFKEAIKLKDHERANLESKAVRHYILTEAITFKKARKLTECQRKNLESQAVSDYIKSNTMPFRNRTIPHRTRLLPFDRALNLSNTQRYNLEHQEVRECIDDERIPLTLQQALDLEPYELENLTSDGIPEAIRYGAITLNKALDLLPEERELLEYRAIRDYIYDGILTLDQALTLETHQFENLISDGIPEAIRSEIITLDQALNLTLSGRENLGSEEIRKAIRDRVITLNEALDLGFDERELLECETVRNFITAGTVTLEQILNPTSHYFAEFVANLDNETICDCINDGIITLEQALQFSPADDWEVLESQTIRDYIYDGILTLERALSLQNYQFERLTSDGISEAIRNGIITLNQALNPILQHQIIWDQEVNRQRIHHNANDHDLTPDRQSVHRASVNQSASDTVGILKRLYGEEVNQRLNEIIQDVTSFVDNISDDSVKNSAAKRCIGRITNPDNYPDLHTYTEGGPEVTMREVIALVYLAIHDESRRTSSLEDAKEQFIEGLYEIQRGYNLQDSDADNGAADSPICTQGTFVKLIEKLQGVHQDCGLSYITPEMATQKLQIVVKEEIMAHMQTLANPRSEEELQSFTDLVSRMKDDGPEEIWQDIKDKIADRMFDEFGGLYDRDRAHPSFIELIDCGQYIETPDFEALKEQADDSYLSYLINKRHDSPADQREYDKKFGLIVQENQVPTDPNHYRPGQLKAVISPLQWPIHLFLRPTYTPTCVFFGNQEDNKLIAERHDSAKAQREHDKKFGLIVQKQADDQQTDEPLERSAPQ